MTLALAEIATHRTRLRQEIMERECLLAAFDVVEKYAAQGHAPNSMQFGSLVSALLPSRPTVELKELAPPAVTPATPPPPPPPPPVERYVNPELTGLDFTGNGSYTNLVRWAIRRMTSDFSVHDIAAMLHREGSGLNIASISTVLSRLRIQGQIEELKRGAGPHPTVFRNPNPPEDDQTDPVAEAEESNASPVSLLPNPIG